MGVTDHQETVLPQNASTLLRTAVEAATVAETHASSDVKTSQAWSAVGALYVRCAAAQLMVDDRQNAENAYRLVNDDDDRADPYNIGAPPLSEEEIRELVLLRFLMEQRGGREVTISADTIRRLSQSDLDPITVTRHADGSLTLRV